MNLPTIIKLGHFNIQIKPVDSELASHNEEEGSFHSGTRTIYIDQNMVLDAATFLWITPNILKFRY